MVAGVDPSRLAALERELGLDAAEIASILVSELTRALGGLETALAAGDLERAADAAHAARNSALMLSDPGLLGALGTIEEAARAGDPAAAHAALPALRDAWDPVRRSLAATGRES